ncbi:MAG: NAD(P)-binding protein [Actinomycetes bacterium]
MVAADYLIVGAGAAGMAFADALLDHADVRVALVDGRHGVAGHWLDAYPFVRLHQASAFYGVASTQLGQGRTQSTGPEIGLYERATAPQVVAYYAGVLERLTASGQVLFFSNCEYRGGAGFVSVLSGKRYEVTGSPRIVDARYLSPDIPARTPPPFAVADGARVITVNELARVADAPREFVVVGSGKTATDACVWLLDRGVDPDAIRWIRPREPWMINRAVLQPDPVRVLGMAADTMEAAIASASPDDMFLRLEEAGVVLRIDRGLLPTMAKTPTIASWEIDRLRSIENVVRRGRVRGVETGRITLTGGDVRVSTDAVVVHCAASGLKYPPVVPIWGDGGIVLQPVRPGFPCFGAAAIGYVEATRDSDDEKNRVCQPSCLSDTPVSWSRMQALGNRAARALSAEPDIKAWANGTTLNPARITPERADDPEVRAAMDRFQAHVVAGMARLAEYADLTSEGR